MKGKYTGGILIAVILWGMSYVWKKSLLELSFMTPLMLVTFRIIIATITLFLIAGLKKMIQPLTKKDIAIFFGLACVDPVGYFLLEANGLMYVTPTLASVIIATIPLFTPFTAYFLTGERVSRNVWLGLFLSMAGVLLVILSDGADNFSGRMIGIIMLFGAVVTSIIYTITVKKLTRRFNSFSIVAWQNLFSMILLAPLLLLIDFENITNIEFGWDWFTKLIVLGVFCSAIAFVFYADALRKLGITRTSIFVNLMPGITAIASYFFFGEPLGAMKIAGITVTIIGLYVGGLSRQSAKESVE